MAISNQQKNRATKKLNVTPQPLKIRGGAPSGNVSKSEILQRMLENKVVRYVDNEIIDQSGNTITGAFAVPWAKFIVDSTDPALGIDPAVEMTYVISDKEVYPNGPRPRFYVRPDAPGNKRFLISDSLYVPTFASRPAAATWPGLKIMIGDFGNAIARSDGTDYVSDRPQYPYSASYGSVAEPTKSSGTGTTSFAFDIGAPKIPANLIVPNKTLFLLRNSGYRTGANAVCNVHYRIGTAGGYGDSGMWSYFNLPATDGQDWNGSSLLRATLTTASAHAIVTNLASNLGGGGGTADLLDRSTNINFAADMYLSAAAESKNVNDNILLMGWSLEWLR